MTGRPRQSGHFLGDNLRVFGHDVLSPAHTCWWQRGPTTRAVAGVAALPWSPPHWPPAWRRWLQQPSCTRRLFSRYL